MIDYYSIPTHEAPYVCPKHRRLFDDAKRMEAEHTEPDPPHVRGNTLPEKKECR